MKLFEMKHIKKSFGALDVLRDISLEVDKGEVLSIIGPSGSGKSTLLRCATLLEKMDAGELIYLGEKAAWEQDDKKGQKRCVYAPKDKLKQIRSYFGLVFQSFNLFPHYSVMKNIIDAPVCVNHVSKNEAKERAKKLLAQLGLSDKENAYPCQLSGGQQQRVSIARALAGNPSVILADEPTGALDSRTGREVLGFLQKLNQEGDTVVLITHDNSIAVKAKRIVRLQDGRIIYDGDASDPAAVVQPEETGADGEVGV